MAKKSSATIVEIARRLGVCHSTVSRSLADSPLISDKTKKRVLALAKELNYTKNPFADGLRTGQTRIIELLYCTSATHLYDDPLLLMILDCVSQELEARDYHVMLNIHKTKSKKSRQDWTHRQGIVDGTILVSPQALPPHYRDQIDKDHCVLLDNVIAGCTSVTFDTDDAMEKLIQYTIEQGKSSVCAVTVKVRSHYPLRQRIKSYNKVCARYQDKMINLGLVEVANEEDVVPTLRELDRQPQAVITLYEMEGLFEGARKAKTDIPQGVLVAAITDMKKTSWGYRDIPRIVLNWSELVHQAADSLLTQIKGTPPVTTPQLIRSPLLIPPGLK